LGKKLDSSRKCQILHPVARRGTRRCGLPRKVTVRHAGARECESAVTYNGGKHGNGSGIETISCAVQQ
jgi:hypothetical protein